MLQTLVASLVGRPPKQGVATSGTQAVLQLSMHQGPQEARQFQVLNTASPTMSRPSTMQGDV
jgi:hypothetical protein